ncbi:MAG: DnaJ domain-containing protein [Synergistaceae bacterium]|jgi:hypothetical protein|nr:DnaJ domain-containing protein [Synergistaceae bacterium]
MATLKNYYFILGVNRNASPAEIEAAYKNHSGAVDNDASQASLTPELTEAYRCLSDPVRRREYDDAFGEPQRVCPTGNIHNFKSNESGIAVDLAFQKRLNWEKSRKTAAKNLVMAVILVAFTLAAFKYGTKYFGGENLTAKTGDLMVHPAKPSPAPQQAAPQSEAGARTVRTTGEKYETQTYAVQTGGVVTLDRSACRTKPSETADIVAVMRKDTPIFATQEIRGGDGNVWYYITNSQFKGWVNGKDVKVHKF